MTDPFDFDASTAAENEARGDGPSFKLRGNVWQCLPVAPAHVLRSLVASSNSVDGVFGYLESLLVEDQREAFREQVLESDEVDLAILNKVVTFVSEKYNGRPTTPSSPSD